MARGASDGPRHDRCEHGLRRRGDNGPESTPRVLATDPARRFLRHSSEPRSESGSRPSSSLIDPAYTPAVPWSGDPDPRHTIR